MLPGELSGIRLGICATPLEVTDATSFEVHAGVLLWFVLNAFRPRRTTVWGLIRATETPTPQIHVARGRREEVSLHCYVALSIVIG